jgi:hypothetical protein
MSDALEKLLREARKDMGKREAQGVNWAAVDSALFARIEHERHAERARFTARRAGPWMGAGIAAAAAAAVLAVFVGKSREPTSAASSTASAEENAGTIVAADGQGMALVDGHLATAGTSLRLGDVIEARGGPVGIDRPGKLTLVLEPGSRATVTHVQGALVLALEQGAIEAQVVPIASGEAFAVDIARSRVAVHGTHLRVARAGDLVAVDLSEGVVSVGEAPRVGSVLGALVTAPAHAEFAAADTLGTLTVVHTPALIRAPVALRASAPSRADLGAHAEVVPPKPEANASRVLTPMGGATHPEVRSPSGPPQQPLPDPNAEATVASVVRACMAERPRIENVTILVSTTLHLELSDEGAVRAARFDPPVAPDVNGCAAQAIYKTRFAHGGAVAIRIDFQN